MVTSFLASFHPFSDLVWRDIFWRNLKKERKMEAEDEHYRRYLLAIKISTLPSSYKGLDMDLETENRIATILLKEAAELRRQAESEGALSYLNRPSVRGRPNSRFLTATVLGVQQANRAVEVNEIWKLRQKEVELENRRSRERCYTDSQAQADQRKERNMILIRVKMKASEMLKLRNFYIQGSSEAGELLGHG